MHNLIEVPLDRIDFSDRTLKISRNLPGEGLFNSIRDFGILDPPLLIRSGPRFTIALGFNRLQAARDLGWSTVDASVADVIDPSNFLNLGILKSLRNELGPMGKVKLVTLMRDHFHFDSGRILTAGTAGLNMPLELIEGSSPALRLERFPIPLIEYLDGRDINFRTILDLCRLPDDYLDFLGLLVERGQVRVNIFRKIADMVYDLSKRDRDAGGLISVLAPAGQEDSRYDERIYDLVFRLRYPEYSAKRERVMDLVGQIPGGTARILLPDYLEGDRITVSFSMGRKDDPAEMSRKIGSIICGTAVRELVKII